MSDRSEHRDRVRISAFGRSDRGQVRAANQDSLLMADLGRPEPLLPGDGGGTDSVSLGPVDFVLGEAGAVFMVADGMGGRAGGARASAVAVRAVLDTLDHGTQPVSTPAAMVRRLDASLKDANRIIHEEGSGDETLRGMGTTATLAGLLGTCVYLAQVGDSRAYLVRHGTVGRLTRDQSLVQDMIDMGILTEAEAEASPNNQILQAVGVSPTVTPALTYHELRKGDMLVLCSDGLSRVVRDSEISSAVTPNADCESICNGLIDLANARGGPDNITVLVAQIDGEGLEEPQEQDVVERLPYELGPE